LTSSSAARGL